MSKQEIVFKTYGILENLFNIEKKELTLDSTFVSYGIDSLEIIIVIEKEFKISFPDDIILSFNSIISIAEFIVTVAEYIDLTFNEKQILYYSN
jgi:acyl carrier protein